MVDWPHAPLHRFGSEGLYFVTAATYLKRHYYRSRSELDRLQQQIFTLSEKHECHLQAWCIFSNHYHLVAQAEGEQLRLMLTQLHSLEGHLVNERDGVSDRQVWFQFWDTQLTYERSWLARLSYTNANAVRHGLVKVAERYRWCSAAWFARTARASFVKVVNSLKTDRVRVRDDFEPVEVG